MTAMTANLARLGPSRVERAERATLRPAAFAGWVDVQALEPGVELVCHDVDGEIVLAAPGLDVRIDAGRVQWHVTRTSATFLLGHPKVDDRSATAEDVDRTFAGDRDPWARLGGRYAVVRVDLAAREVVLATDRFGVWPLAWSGSGTRIAFSERADCVPLTREATLDPQALFDYVYFHVVPAPSTVFRGVRRIEAASVVRVSETSVDEYRSWKPSFAQSPRPTHAEFRSVVRDAVLAEAEGEVPGCFLSGGTDSSTVAGMLARHGGGRVKTFSIGFDAEGYDEMAYARIAARHFGTDHHEHYVTPDDLVKAIPLVASQYDQPFGNSSAVPAYICALLAGDNGVRCIMAGDGGDELFGGNLRYAKQKLFETYWHMPRALKAGLIEPLLLTRAARAVPGVAKASSYVAQARVPMPARIETYNLLQRFGAHNVFQRDFLERVDTTAPATLQAEVYGRCADAAFVDRMLAYDWRFTLTDNDLPKVTGTAQLAGLAVRFPLLADAVVDLSLRLQAHDKVRGLKLRHFFKEALTGFLPPEIIAKKKHGFGLPVGPWLVTHAGFRALAYESLNGLVERGLIEPGLVADLFSRRLEEHPGYYGEMAWVLMMLEHWLRSHAPSWSSR